MWYLHETYFGFKDRKSSKVKRWKKVHTKQQKKKREL